MSVAEIELARERHEVVGQLLDQGYANVSLPLDATTTEELFEGFSRFAELIKMGGDQKLAKAVTFRVGNRDNGDYSISARKPGEAPKRDTVGAARSVSKDEKNVMHFSPQTITNAQKTLGYPLPLEMGDFLDMCNEVYEIGRTAAREASKALDLQEVLFPTGRKDQEVHHLRLIDYFATESEQLGEAHFDRALATLAMSESHPGLRGAPTDNGYLRPPTREEIYNAHHMEPIEHHPGVGKFFLDAGARRLPEYVRRWGSLDEIPLLAHDIVNEKFGVNRLAVVMFFNPAQTFAPYQVPTTRETKLHLSPLNNPSYAAPEPQPVPTMPDPEVSGLPEPDNSDDFQPPYFGD